MDGSRFDAWTRRRFGLATGGALAAVLSPSAFDHAQGKRKKRKKRCRKLHQACDPGGKKKRCCKGLTCNDETNGPDVGACCRHFQAACQSESQCCGELECATVSALGGLRCCAADGDSCQESDDCCDTAGDCIDGTCRAGSDRAIKTNFASVDGRDMLARVRDLPIATWNYASDAPHVRHIGPMAQDFAAAFGVGSDDRHIHPIDGQGVALAAIQGLVTELERLREVNVTLAARVAALENARS